jgi:hypothetical protein
MSGTRFLGLPLHWKSVLWVLLVLLFLGLHFYDAQADPSLLKTTEDIHDEAWWAENARQKVLYDRWTVDCIAFPEENAQIERNELVELQTSRIVVS